MSNSRKRAIRAIMAKEGISYTRAMLVHDRRRANKAAAERDVEEALSEATWIGLSVATKDLRWRDYYQPSPKIGAPHITLAFMGAIDDKMYDIVVEKTYAWYNLGIFRTQRECINTVEVTRASLFGGRYTVFEVKEPAAYENGYLTNRDILTSSLNHNGVPVNADYDFTPHISVSYGAYMPIPKDRVAGMKFTLTDLFISHRGEKKTFWYT